VARRCCLEEGGGRWSSLLWARSRMELAARVWFCEGYFVSPLRGRTAAGDLVFGISFGWRALDAGYCTWILFYWLSWGRIRVFVMAVACLRERTARSWMVLWIPGEGCQFGRALLRELK
jgi:hypothetical protein